MNKNIEKSKTLAKKVKAKQQMCYRNASRIVLDVPGYENAVYVEGIAIMKPGCPIEHGWVEHDGEILDPTLPDEELVYFAGLRFRGEGGLLEALAIPKNCEEDFPIFYRFGWGGADSLEFCQAWDAAWDFVFQQGTVTGEKPASYLERWKARKTPTSDSERQSPGPVDG